MDHSKSKNTKWEMGNKEMGKWNDNAQVLGHCKRRQWSVHVLCKVATVMISLNWCHFAYSHFAYSHFVYLLPLSAISPTHAKCAQNNVEQLKLQSLLHFGVIVLI